MLGIIKLSYTIVHLAVTRVHGCLVILCGTRGCLCLVAHCTIVSLSLDRWALLIATGLLNLEIDRASSIWPRSFSESTLSQSSTHINWGIIGIISIVTSKARPASTYAGSILRLSLRLIGKQLDCYQTYHQKYRLN